MLWQCQREWYDRAPFMSPRPMVCNTSGGAAAAATLSGPAAPLEPWRLVSYMDTQCSSPYTGNMCGSCQCGYFRNLDWECRPCNSVGVNVVVGLGIISVTTVVILYMVWTNAVEAAKADGGDETLHAAGASGSIVPPSHSEDANGASPPAGSASPDVVVEPAESVVEAPAGPSPPPRQRRPLWKRHHVSAADITKVRGACTVTPKSGPDCSTAHGPLLAC